MALVRLYANLRGIFNKDQTIVDATAIREIIEILEHQGGKKFKELMRDQNGVLRQNTIILVNGKNINFIKGVDTEIRGEDTVDIFPPLAGG